MNNFALKIWYDEGRMCTFYTVSKDGGEDDSETDRFFENYAIDESPVKEEALKLFRLVTESIGNRYGAMDAFFDRSENRAQALPPKPKNRVEELRELGENFPLRLFCYRISPQIVVLFGGGLKDARTVQESAMSMKFYEAQVFVKSIQDAIANGIIEITKDKRYLQDYKGASEIIYL